MTDKFAEKDIFGSDSELSDAPEAEEDFPKPPKHIGPIRPDEDESSAGESADDYEDSAPKKKRKVRRRRGGDEDEEVAEVGRRRTTQRKRKRKAERTEQDLSNLPKEEADKIRLDMRLDAILKPKKTSRPKKRKKDEDVLDRFADEEVSRLREAMLAAAEDDEKANKEKLPATAKLRMLPEVMTVLRKSGLSQSIIDNNLFEGVRRWLEPLPDRSLPALNIQKEFMETIQRLEYIDTNVLIASKLGRIVLFYTKCKRVTPDVARIANTLVSTWSRPIIKRSASYRDREIPLAIDMLEDSQGGASQGGTQAPRQERLAAILARAKESEKGKVRKNAVMIPQRELGNYSVAPRANAGIMKPTSSVDVDVERRRKNADRMRSFTRRITQKQ